MGNLTVDEHNSQNSSSRFHKFVELWNVTLFLWSSQLASTTHSIHFHILEHFSVVVNFVYDDFQSCQLEQHSYSVQANFSGQRHSPQGHSFSRFHRIAKTCESSTQLQTVNSFWSFLTQTCRSFSCLQLTVFTLGAVTSHSDHILHIIESCLQIRFHALCRHTPPCFDAFNIE